MTIPKHGNGHSNSSYLCISIRNALFSFEIYDNITCATIVMTAQQRPPMKLVVNTSSTHGAIPVNSQTAAKGKDVSRSASRRPRRIIQSPIIAPNHAPNMDRDATHETSCFVTENAHLCDSNHFCIFLQIPRGPLGKLLDHDMKIWLDKVGMEFQVSCVGNKFHTEIEG